jgi:hypothetical protein
MIKIFPKYVRILWAFPLACIYGLVYGVIYLLSAKARATYSVNKFKWDNIKTLEQLQNYFKTAYKYKADGLLGLLDHFNFAHEFFIAGGDCDDAAFYACDKLREIGYKADVFWIYGNGPQNWHFDCYLEKMGFFNYGNFISTNTCAIEEDYAMKYGWKNPCKWVKL